MDIEKLFSPSEIRRLSKDETIALYKRHMLAQHERAEAAEKHSREASQMFVSANEHITELLQQESFMERKLAAQREDIERLANRVLTAEAERDAAEQRAADMETALVDDGHDFGDEAIEDLIRVYFEQSDWHDGASATVADEARKAGRDARAARRARAALSAREELT